MESVKVKEDFETKKENSTSVKNGVDGTKKFICDICNFPFAKSIQLKSHKVTHGEKKFRCELCEKCFATKNTMKNHEKSHETTRLLRETCGICKKQFRSKYDLRDHVRIHTNKNHLNVKVAGKASLKRLI